MPDVSNLYQNAKSKNFVVSSRASIRNSNERKIEYEYCRFFRLARVLRRWAQCQAFPNPIEWFYSTCCPNGNDIRGLQGNSPRILRKWRTASSYCYAKGNGCRFKRIISYRCFKAKFGTSSSNGRQYYSRNCSGIQCRSLDSGFRFWKYEQSEVFSQEIRNGQPANPPDASSLRRWSFR